MSFTSTKLLMAPLHCGALPHTLLLLFLIILVFFRSFLYFYHHPSLYFLPFPILPFSLFELTGPISCVVDCGNLEAPFTLYLLFVLKSVVFVSTFFSLASFFLPFLTFDCVSSFFFFVSFLLVVLYLVLFVSFLC